jgi:hypothetical protein
VKIVLAIAIVVVALAAPRDAHAGRCKRGTLLFRIETGPLDSREVSSFIEVRSTGAWSVQAEGAALVTGCLDTATLRTVRKAVKRARFRIDARDGAVVTCAALPTSRLVYRGSRGRKFETESPCGNPVDPGTVTAAACVMTATAGQRGEELAAACTLS